MLANSVKAKNIILLPQNEMFCFEYLPSEKKFYRKCELKNMIPSLKEDSLHEIYEPAEYIDIVYENTKTRVEGHTLSAAFHFNGVTPVSYTHLGRTASGEIGEKTGTYEPTEN